MELSIRGLREPVGSFRTWNVGRGLDAKRYAFYSKLSVPRLETQNEPKQGRKKERAIKAWDIDLPVYWMKTRVKKD